MNVKCTGKPGLRQPARGRLRRNYKTNELFNALALVSSVHCYFSVSPPPPLSTYVCAVSIVLAIIVRPHRNHWTNNVSRCTAIPYVPVGYSIDGPVPNRDGIRPTDLPAHSILLHRTNYMEFASFRHSFFSSHYFIKNSGFIPKAPICSSLPLITILASHALFEVHCQAGQCMANGACEAIKPFACNFAKSVSI